jgi:hypothetical protein
MTTPQTSQNNPTLVKGTAPVDDENFLNLSAEEQIRLVGADYIAAHGLEESGQLDQYRGHYVAVLRGKVVGHGVDALELRSRVAREQGVHPERPAMIYLEDLQSMPLLTPILTIDPPADANNQD